MPASFLIVPQWQGSSSSRAMRLIEGAEAIAGDLPASATRRVAVPLGAGEPLETGIRRYSALADAHGAVREGLEALAAARGTDAPVIVIGGDAGSDLAAIARAARAHPGLVLVWLSAHAGLGPGGAHAVRGGDPLAASAVRAALGEGPAPLAARDGERVAAADVVIAGVRSLDDAEDAFAAAHGVRIPDLDAGRASGSPGPAAAVADAVGAAGDRAIYLHIDLDVLDPGEIAAVDDPEPFGLSVDELTATIRALRTGRALAGAAVTGFAPADRESAERDLPTVLRVLGALTGPLP